MIRQEYLSFIKTPKWHGTRFVKSITNNLEFIYRYVLNKLVGFCYNNIEFIYERNILGDIIRIYNSETGETVGEYVYDGFKFYDLLKDLGKGGKASNIAWLYGKLRSNYKVVDIGINIGRVRNKTGKLVRSSSYIVERIVLDIWKSRNYWKWTYHLF